MKNEEFIKNILIKRKISLEEGCELINQYIFEKKEIYLEKINIPNQHDILMHINLGLVTNFTLFINMFFISESYFKEKYEKL